jgi:hypothetical protein
MLGWAVEFLFCTRRLLKNLSPVFVVTACSLNLRCRADLS